MMQGFTFRGRSESFIKTALEFVELAISSIHFASRLGKIFGFRPIVVKERSVDALNLFFADRTLPQRR